MRTVPLVVQGTPSVSGSQSALAPAGPHADAVANLHWILTWGGVIIFLLDPADRGRHPAAAGTPPRHRRPAVRRLDGPRLPIVVLSALLVYGFLIVQGPLAAPPAKLRVEVVGEQWWWRVVYLDDEGKPRFETANEIRVPVGTPVEYVVKSADVIHSFWVPSLAGKIDMIPGRTNRIRFAASEAGVYRGQCAEYCGGTHALMALYVVALRRRSSSRGWRGASGPAPAPDGCACRARQALFANGCGGRLARGGHLAQRARGLRPLDRLYAYREAGGEDAVVRHDHGEDLVAVAAYLEGLE